MRSSVLAVIMMSIVVIPSMVAGCDSATQEEMAKDVSRYWISTNTTYISEEIARTIGGSIPVNESALTAIITEQVSEHVTWTYSEPERLSDNAYKVIARTILSYEIPQTGSGSVDVGFHLTCSTSEKQREVTSVGITFYSYEYTGS